MWYLCMVGINVAAKGRSKEGCGLVWARGPHPASPVCEYPVMMETRNALCVRTTTEIGLISLPSRAVTTGERQRARGATQPQLLLCVQSADWEPTYLGYFLITD